MQPSRSNSGYWSADTWDPDLRVYAGADIFHTHQFAVEPDQRKAVQNEPAQPRLRERQDSAGYWGALESDATREVQIGSLHADKETARRAVRVSFDEGAAESVPDKSAECDQNGLVRKSSDYWNSSNWDFDRNVPLRAQEITTPTTEASSTLSRKGSNAYWDADQWDPDQRVYVGAEAGQTMHRTAVIDDHEDKLLRAWTGGLTCEDYGGSTAPTLDLADLADLAGAEPPALKDLYDVTADSVGSGSFGVVFLARHCKSDKPCVVKSTKKAQCGSAFKSQVEGGLYESLLDMSRRAPHENIVQYLDALESNDHYYVIMENLRGPELLEKMEREFPITERHCQEVMKEVLSALAHIHDVVNICHRDIKLDNFRYRSPEPGAPLVLLDFGFLARLDQPWDGKKCGTRMFMAPEIFQESVQQSQMPAMDMWAAGVLLYLLFTGDCPVQQEDMPKMKGKEPESQDIVLKALQADLLKSVSKEARQLLEKLLDLEASERLRSADALKHQWLCMDLDGGARAVPAHREAYRRMASKTMKEADIDS
mmetsp:Transcript_29513/g.69608  ORF Transcript_29513/g.69608 Transcript_29513/m.69608 type:complete len:539 (+) Transcript_29513:62-1678(+)|eukprot:s2674_g13.t1